MRKTIHHQIRVKSSMFKNHKETVSERLTRLQNQQKTNTSLRSKKKHQKLHQWMRKTRRHQIPELKDPCLKIITIKRYLNGLRDSRINKNQHQVSEAKITLKNYTIE